LTPVHALCQLDAVLEAHENNALGSVTHKLEYA